MKPVNQLIIDDGKGDCLRACIASILELPMDTVPNFAECGFFDGLQSWCVSRGERWLWFDVYESTGPSDSLDRIYFGGAPEFMVAWGQSPRPKADGGRKQHAVVVSPDGYGVKLAHDPHPDKIGLVTTSGFGFIVKA